MFSSKSPDDQDLSNGLIPVTNTDNKSDEKDTYEATSMPAQTRIDHTDKDQQSIELLKFFRILLWYAYSSMYNWKSLAYSIYHIDHLINHLDNYQIKDSIQKPYRNVLDNFTLFIKDLITIEMQSSKRNDDPSSSTPSEINQIKTHIEKLKADLIHLKDLILTTKDRSNLCKTDLDALDVILQAIEAINFDFRVFDKQDQEKIRLLSLEQDLIDKPTKTDLMQMKIHIDNQMKKIIELNKENAQELERIKLLKTSTCEARHLQPILSTNSSSPSKQSYRNYSHQTSRPYITFELDQIRKYQRQALIRSRYGTIPLYRRQAWAAANLFPHHSLPFLRHLQNSLRMQIHDLLGYDPSDICHTNKKKTKKLTKTSTVEIFPRSDEVLIMGNNNRLYRGRIDSCEMIPAKKSKENKSKIPTNVEEKNDIHFDQFDQSNEQIFDGHLFEYLDWQVQFNEQDLPDELCEDLFNHWISIVCNDQPCHCDPESKSIPIQPKSSSMADIYDDRCMCSECSCSCEKYQDDQSICLCSQCSCKCMRDSADEHQETLENRAEISEEDLENDAKSEEEPTYDPPAIIEQIEEKEIIACDCFLNQTDRWTEQFNPFPLEHAIPFIFNASSTNSQS